jgi:hypothetical protein
VRAQALTPFPQIGEMEMKVWMLVCEIANRPEETWFFSSEAAAKEYILEYCVKCGFKLISLDMGNLGMTEDGLIIFIGPRNIMKVITSRSYR